jgi:hypothetical protein
MMTHGSVEMLFFPDPPAANRRAPSPVTGQNPLAGFPFRVSPVSLPSHEDIMSAHTIAAEALRRIPTRAIGETQHQYADRLRLTVPPIPPLVPSKMGEPAPPASREQIAYHVALRAAELIGAAATLFDDLSEAERRTSKPLAANGRSREAYRRAQADYMRRKRAADKAAKESAR